MTSDPEDRIHFSVDSGLLRELGERLVGQPQIALAELIKNSYDADATEVIVRVDHDQIEVIDNGHGMTFEAFRDFWMRVGSAHKLEARVSRGLRRPLTGSKGIGRLAVQFLARDLEMRTVADESAEEIHAKVDWDEAVIAGDLTNATAWYAREKPESWFPGGSSHGTALRLRRLQQVWTADELQELARQIWVLQPPFSPNPRFAADLRTSFVVKFEGQSPEVTEQFYTQMNAALSLWEARILGRLVSPERKRESAGQVHVRVEFADGSAVPVTFPAKPEAPHATEFEVRVFRLAHRQPRGIKLEDLRAYFREFGGVHVYDGGFHLPYYGPDADWLNIEQDHAHRLSRSDLLPDELQVSEGLNDLPTQSRLFGIVYVDTAMERQLTRALGDGHEPLTIQISRDRLVDNAALRELTRVVRWSIDFYAMEVARRKLSGLERVRSIEPASAKLNRVEDVLERHQKVIPAPVYDRLRGQIREAVRAGEREEELLKARSGLLGALATAGIAALAYEHEAAKQFQELERVIRRLRKLASDDGGSGSARADLREIATRLSDWLARARGTRNLFSPLLDAESRDRRSRMRARVVVDEIVQRMRFLLRGIDVDTSEVDSHLRLPPGSLAEWGAVFQNVLLNAANAVIDAGERRIVLSSAQRGQQRALVVQNTGVGVDLTSSEALFEPFHRRADISQERRALGYGGTGLGLTIVRMIATELGCRVGFVAPYNGFQTAFRLSWTESA